MKPWSLLAWIFGVLFAGLIAAFAYFMYAMCGVVLNMPLDYPENEDHDI